MRLSIVVPVMDEEENLPALYDRLTGVFDAHGYDGEFVLVDDGSTDNSRRILRDLAERDDRVKVVLFRRNFGQTAAMQAGLRHATGDVIITMDADLQNDPADIPRMLEALDDETDLVHGWRKDRHDAWLSRKLPSRCANWLISRVTKFPIHDLGCTLKAIRREFAADLELYGEMHRFIPILAHRVGARCKELVVTHHARTAGKSKYGISRTFRVLLDLITVQYMLRYFTSPMKLFGMIGLWSYVVAGAAAAACVAMKVAAGVDMTGNPCLLLAVLGCVAGTQFLTLGLLGEVAARIYFSLPGRDSYVVGQTFNVDQAPHILAMPEAPGDRAAAKAPAAHGPASRRAA